MNRRELLTAMTSACSAAGLAHAGEFAVYGGERKPTLAVIHSARPLPQAAVEAIREQWERLREMSPDLPPCVVMTAGLTLEMLETIPPTDGK
ncbi:MAG: hypothetical protein EBR82_68790 [Caulobacteraceae bacterium]|jgi:hypothetical protein|nr:hypothetical protein [Caulobacteraceae bacterium]